MATTFVIVNNNNQVVFGPAEWNKYRFQTIILEELNLTTVLAQTNFASSVIINDQVKILPVQSTPNPVFNPKTEMLNGPFWDFTNNIATSSFAVQPMAVDAIKNSLKAEIAAIRWTNQNKTITLVYNTKSYAFETGTATIATLHNAVVTGVTQLKWKVNGNEWITLTPVLIKTLLNYLIQHQQAWFNWENSVGTLIEACATQTELNLLDHKANQPVVVQPSTAPATISMRQARLALQQQGLLGSVATAIAALTEPSKTAAMIEWEYSSELTRNKPFVIQLGAAIGLTVAQLDSLFAYAATL